MRSLCRSWHARPLRLILTLWAAGAIGCAPSRKSEPASPPSHRTPAATIAAAPADDPEFLALIAELERAEVECKNTCCDAIAKLPPWLTKWWTQAIDDDEPARQRTLRVLETSRNPAVVSLAALRLGSFGRSEDVTRLAALADRTEPAAPLVTPPPMTQAPVFCPAPATRRTTLGEVALIALTKPTGQRFTSAADLRRWLAQHGTEPTVAAWEARLQVGDPATLGPRFRAEAPALFCRAALAPSNEHSVFIGWLGQSGRLKCAESIGPDRLLALLSSASDQTFPELAEPTRKAAFAKFVLLHAESTLKPEHADRLIALRASPERNALHLPADLLAVAASRLAPEQRRAILTAAASDSSTRPGFVLVELARHFPDEERARIVAGFYGDSFEQRPILAALAEAGPRARPTLRDIALDPRLSKIDAFTLEKLVATLHKSAPPGIDCPDLSAGGKELGRLDASEREARYARARAAGKTCIARIRKHLARP